MDEQAVFMQLMPPKPHLLAMRIGKWKLIAPHKDSGTPHLYDLVRDPGERKNLAPSQGNLLRRFLVQLDHWRKQLSPPPELSTKPLTNGEIEEQLRSLGYLE